MEANKPTLAIYGIQDRHENDYPLYVHDHNITFANQGEINYFLQQERITRRKRDNTLHIHLKQHLKEMNLLSEDYDLIFVDNVVGRTFLTRDGDARFEAPLTTKLATGVEKGKCWWFGKEKNAYVLNHELAHIFTCLPFYGNFKDNSLLVHYDGGASLSNFSAAIYNGGIIQWIDYDWQMKPFSSIYNANAIVFGIIGAKIKEQNAVPGKFMGFAGCGTPREELIEWLSDNDYFQDIWGKTSLFFKQAKLDFGITLRSFDQKHIFIQDVAASLQEIFIQQLVKRLQQLAEKTKAEYLYYSGGSALNIVANTRVLKNNLFKEVYIPPCCEDSGLSLGAAAYAEWIKHGYVKKQSFCLNNWKIEQAKPVFSGNTLIKVAEMIFNGKIIGICNGYGEAGPRALGNRSIISIANSKKISNLISMVMKDREWYRPLAPVALKKNIKYFAGNSKIPVISKYMLADFHVLPEKQSEIKGAIHADGTARFQTIFGEDEKSFIGKLLTILDEKYQIKAIINTSFNQKNEPIVHTHHEAIRAAHKMKLDGLVLDGQLYSANDF